MGNWGNTMDRWYRRAAIVFWPRERAFAVRAEASPAWALRTLKRRIRAGDLPEAREMAASLEPFWEAVAPHEERRGFFEDALRVAEGLHAPALAAFLMRPFRVEAVTPGRARAFAALVERYGADWSRTLLAEGRSSDRLRMRLGRRDRPSWLTSLPHICEALRGADEAGKLAARILLQDQWEWLKDLIEETRDLEAPSRRDKALASLARPILGFLEGTEVARAPDVRDAAVTYLCARDDEAILPCLVQVLRAAARKKATAIRTETLDAIRRHCVRRLEARLERPERAEDDWSIALPEGCRCELCATLEAFLSDPDEKQLEWPIAKEKRRHVHNRLDAHELPVRHETRRSGSPYTLVLTKTKDLFTREAEERQSFQADLDWLTSSP